MYVSFVLPSLIGPSPWRAPLPSPVDVLLPICKRLVISVEAKLKAIVDEAIEDRLKTFPDLKLAVKTCNIGHIFEAKRSETETFIEQFVQMQKKSVDRVAVKVPLPHEITQWEGYTITLAPKQRPFEHTPHPIMTAPLMSQLKHLSQQVYPQELLEKIAKTSVKGSYRVRRHAYLHFGLTFLLSVTPRLCIVRLKAGFDELVL